VSLTDALCIMTTANPNPNDPTEGTGLDKLRPVHITKD